MIKPIFILVISALFLVACASTPPKPPTCKDDGRGMVSLNPQMMSEDTVKAVKKKYRRVRFQKIEITQG